MVLVGRKTLVFDTRVGWFVIGPRVGFVCGSGGVLDQFWVGFVCWACLFILSL